MDRTLEFKITEVDVEESMGEKTPLVSMIIPVYNAAAYLKRCVDSVLQQTYEQIQVILVNDGSTDDSLAICQHYAKQDSRVVVLDKENSGVSDSRNRGIQRAEGTYVQFVDSDDWLVPNATELLVQKAEEAQCQLVIAPFYRVLGRMVIVNGHIREEKKISLQEFALQLMKAPANFYYGVMWNKLYRRDLIVEWKIRCAPEIQWCEDFIFNLHYLQHVQQVYVLQQPIYYYVKRRDSLVSTELRSSKLYEMKREVFVHYRGFYESIGLYEAHKGKINSFMLAVTTDSLFRLPAGILEQNEEEVVLYEFGGQKERTRHKLKTGARAAAFKKIGSRQGMSDMESD